MVKYANVDHVKRSDDFMGKLLIGFTGLRMTTGVIVRQYDGSSVMFKRGLDDFSGLDGSTVDSSLKYHFTV